MKRLHVLVEGQTEDAFVRDVLTPHLVRRGVHPTSILLKTKRVKSGGAFRGGVTTTKQVLDDLGRLLGDSSADGVTTILDYYALPDDFPGLSSLPPGDAYARVAHVETALLARFATLRFIPHLVLHEYETWIFSSPRACDWVFDEPSVISQLEGICATAGGAERIDEGPSTAPSKRISKVFPSYRKALHGPIAVGAIGIAALRDACPHADAWLERLETL